MSRTVKYTAEGLVAGVWNPCTGILEETPDRGPVTIIEVDVVAEADGVLRVIRTAVDRRRQACELRAGGDGDDVVDGRWHGADGAVPGVGGEGRPREAHCESRYESQQQSEELFLTHNMHILSDVVFVSGDTGHAS